MKSRGTGRFIALAILLVMIGAGIALERIEVIKRNLLNVEG